MEGTTRKEGTTGAQGDQGDWFGERPESGEPGVLVGWIERYDGMPDELTLFPPDVPDEERVVTWISASEGSFVDLATMR